MFCKIKLVVVFLKLLVCKKKSCHGESSILNPRLLFYLYYFNKLFLMSLMFLKQSTPTAQNEVNELLVTYLSYGIKYWNEV